jgi:hypothetical protein
MGPRMESSVYRREYAPNCIPVSMGELLMKLLAYFRRLWCDWIHKNAPMQFVGPGKVECSKCWQVRDWPPKEARGKRRACDVKGGLSGRDHGTPARVRF